MKARTITIVCCLVISCGLYALAGSRVAAMRHGVSLRFQSPRTRLPVDVVRIVAGEFKGLLADYMILEAGSFIGSNQEASAEDWANIHRVLSYALALDPRFQQAYIYAQGNLPWDAGMYQETIDLLDIARRNRPWDFYPPYFMAFDYYYFLADYGRSSHWFLEAAKIPGAPAIYGLLGARMALKSGRTQTAIVLLRSMLEERSLGDNEKKEIRMRIQALEGALAIERAIEAYRSRHGSLPPSLQALLDEGLLHRLPENPYGGPYLYDSITGEVAFDTNL